MCIRDRVNAVGNITFGSFIAEKRKAHKFNLRDTDVYKRQLFTKATIGSRPERLNGHIGNETRPRLLREAAVGNIAQWGKP